MIEPLQPTEAEVEAAWPELGKIMRIPEPDLLTVTLREAVVPILTAALAVSPLREQVQKLTEENERLKNSAEDVLSHACRGVAETRAHEAEAANERLTTENGKLRAQLAAQTEGINP